MSRKSVVATFREIAKKFPESVAIEHMDQRTTYADLENRSEELARFLSQNSEPGARVGILSEDVVQIVTAILASLKAGRVFVPLDTKAPEKRLGSLVLEAAPAWYVTQEQFLEKVLRIAAATSAKAQVICTGQVDTLPRDCENIVVREVDISNSAAASTSLVEIDTDEICYIYYTSGSTGKPKGIAGRLKGVDHFIEWEIKTLSLSRELRVSQFTVPTFDAFLRDCFVPLCTGGTMCVPDNREAILDARQLARWINHAAINLIHCVPSLFRLLISEDLKSDDFASLRYVLMSGEPLLVSDVRKWFDVFGERVQLVNLYGPTETTMTKLFYFVQPTDRNRRSIPIGRPMEGARAIIVDGKGRASPPGAIGEIYIRTPYRTLGYYNQPELTGAAFIPNPFNHDPRDLVYRTGDLGRILDDGNFEFLGRQDQQVKIRGLRVELAEIENVLRAHEAVKHGIVIDREDASGSKFLCAYVVLNREVSPGELKEHFLQELPDYLIPTAFVVLDALPQLPNGKVNRRALPPPDRSLLNLTGSYVPARDNFEFQLAQIWRGLLNVQTIGMTDNFFELGGHSLLAVQLMSRIEKQFGRVLPLSALFRAPTIERLAVVLREDEESQPWTPLVKMQPEGANTPLFCLHPAGGDVLLYAMLTIRLGRDQPVYGLQAEGITGAEAPYRSIEEMARLYLQEIRKTQAAGPYYVCGASMGGMLAFEVARQLRAAGQEVGLLALIDTRSSVPAEQLDWDDAHILYDRLSEYFPLSLDHLQMLSPDNQLLHIMEEARKRNYLYPGYGIRQARAFLSVFRNSVRAVIAYKPKFYPGCVTLFSTSDSRRLAEDPLDGTRGWYKLAHQVVVHEIPGNHSNMLDEPHVKVTADLIKTYLDQVHALTGT